MLMRSLRNCCHQLLIKIRNKLFFSVWIRYLIEGNLFITYEAIFYIKEKGSFDDTKASFNTLLRIIVLIILVLWIVFATVYPTLNKSKLEEPTFKRKFGSLYTGISTKRCIAIIYTAVFCLRRLALVLFLLWLGKSKDQALIYAYIAIYSAFLLYLSHAWPNEDPTMNRLEHFNEICVIALHYTMICYVYGTNIEPFV